MSGKSQPLAWKESVRSGAGRYRERFIESHLDLVRYLALRIVGRLPASVDLDDLIHDGVLGLLEAIERFDPGRAVAFRTYAETRVRGAILDSLRRKDWRPRSLREQQRALDAAIAGVSSREGRAATEDEIAREMSLPIADYRRLLQDLRSGSIVPLAEPTEDQHPAVTDVADMPHDKLERLDLIDALAEEIERLPERERQVLELYYHEELNMKEIGSLLGVSESRICQIHSQAAGRLRRRLRTRMHAAPRARRRPA